MADNSNGSGGTNMGSMGSTGAQDFTSLFPESPWGGLSDVGFTSLEQVFRGNSGGNLARSDGNAPSGGGDTSGGGANPMSGGGNTCGGVVNGASTGGNKSCCDGNAPSAGGNTSGGAGNPSDGGGAGNSPEVDAAVSEPILSAIETERPLTSEESQKLADDVGKLIEGSIDITGSSEGDSSTSGDALLSGGAGSNSNSLGVQIRSMLDGFFISEEFSNNFTEVPANTDTASVLPISGGSGSGGGSNAPSDNMFGSSPWGRLNEVGIDSFSDVFGGGGAASGSNPVGGV